MKVAAEDKWMEPQEFQELLTSKQIARKTLVVPRVPESGLRIKIVDVQDYSVIKSLKHCEVLEDLEDVVFLFGVEPLNLRNKRCYGEMVSHWGKDPKVTKLSLGYDFIVFCLAILGIGFGSRGETVPSHGLNWYGKPEGRGTAATIGSPAQALEDIMEQQYYRESENRLHLCQPLVRKKLNQLTTDVGDIARDVNPDLMKLVGRTCSRQILTSGNVPKKKKSSNHFDLASQKGSKSPARGFINGSHIHKLDALTKGQVKAWTETAKERKWTHVLKSLEAEGFCLPTTCAYQFVFDDGDRKDQLKVKAMFSMEGLGLAVPIVHGVAHHFMGAKFSHHTCLPVCQEQSSKKVNASNHDDDFLIIGWGSSGGRKEVSQQLQGTKKKSRRGKRSKKKKKSS
jgi:hypothetical protein